MNELTTVFDGVKTTSIEVATYNGSVPTVVRKDGVAKIPMELSRAVLGLHRLEGMAEDIRKSVVYPLAKTLMDAGITEAWFADGNELGGEVATVKVNGSRKAKDVLEFDEEFAKTINFMDLFNACVDVQTITESSTVFDVYKLIMQVASTLHHTDGIDGTPTIMFPVNSVQEIKEVK